MVDARVFYEISLSKFKQFNDISKFRKKVAEHLRKKRYKGKPVGQDFQIKLVGDRIYVVSEGSLSPESIEYSRSIPSAIKKYYQSNYDQRIGGIEIEKVDASGLISLLGDIDKLHSFKSGVESEIDQVKQELENWKNDLADYIKTSEELQDKESTLDKMIRQYATDIKQHERNVEQFYKTEKAPLTKQILDLKKQLEESADSGIKEKYEECLLAMDQISSEKEDLTEKVNRLEDVLHKKTDTIRIMNRNSKNPKQDPEYKKLLRKYQDVRSQIDILEGKLLETEKNGTHPNILKFQNRKQKELEMKIQSLESQVERYKNMDMVDFTSQYEAVIKTLHAYLPKLLEFAPSLVTLTTARSDDLDEIIEKNITDLRLDGICDGEPIGLIESIKDTSDEEIETILGDHYDRINSVGFKAYENNRDALDKINGAISDIQRSLKGSPEIVKNLLLGNMDELKTGVKTIDGVEENKGLDYYKSQIKEYLNLRQETIDHDIDLLKESIEAYKNIDEQELIFDDLREKLGDKSNLPVAFTLGVDPEHYQIKMVLPIDKVGAEQIMKGYSSDRNQESDEVTGLRFLYNKLIRETVFGGEDTPKYRWFSLVDSGQSEPEFLDDKTGLMYHSFKISRDDQSAAFAVRRVAEMAASVNEGFNRTGLPECGFNLETSILVEPSFYQEFLGEKQYINDPLDISEKTLYSLIQSFNDTTGHAKVKDLKPLALQEGLEPYGYQKAITSLLKKGLIHEEGNSSGKKYFDSRK